MATKRDIQRSQIAKIKDYQNLFNSPLGKKVLQDMMHQHYIMNSTWNESPHLMAIREGERNAVLRILTILKIDIADVMERIDKDEKIRFNEAVV